VKSLPLVAPTAASKVNTDACILLNHVVIASNVYDVNDVLCLLCVVSHLYYLCCVTLEFLHYRLFSMHVLCIFSTYLTLGIRNKDLHSIVRSRRPVVVPIIKCPPIQNHGPHWLPN